MELSSEICGKLKLIAIYLQLMLTQLVRSNHLKQRELDCYSCMSNYYAPFWTVLSEVYQKPSKFDDECESPTTSRKILSVRCRSVCVVIREKLFALGISMKRSGFIRGCLDTLVKRPNRFNESALDLHRLISQPSCRVADISQLLVGPNQQTPKSVSICTCSHSYCESQVNSGPSWMRLFSTSSAIPTLLGLWFGSVAVLLVL